MVQCTAPVKGHRTASGRANCPACSGAATPHYAAPSPVPPGSGRAGASGGDPPSPVGGRVPPAASLGRAKTAPPFPKLSGGRYTRTVASEGVSLADLLILAIIGRGWETFHARTDWWGVLIVASLVVLPFVASAWLSRHCTAWNATVGGRCAKVRPQPFRRCEVSAHGHGAQFVTAHEVGAVVCFLLGLLALLALFTL